MANLFEVEAQPDGGGRLGRLRIGDRVWSLDHTQPLAMPTEIDTPYVFPVINVIGGPAPPDRNGGLWRPVKWWMFLHPPQTQAFLCQVLHAVDFNLNGASWQEWLQHPFSKWIDDWRKKRDYVQPKSAKGRPDYGYPFREWMKHWQYWAQPPGALELPPPITFLDSGGFTLMKLTSLLKAKERLKVDETPESILDLQERLGGDLVASLDYPLPPGLSEEEIRERQERSIDNALAMLRLLSHRRHRYRPIPYVAVHGTNRHDASWYVHEFFRRWRTELSTQEREVSFGFAVGSMVPRSDDPRTVVEVVWGITRELKENQCYLDEVNLPAPPIHVFGINSYLTGFLTYLGVDTFDSTTFADVAQRANYLGDDFRPTRIDRVTYETLDACGCVICQGLSRARGTNALENMQQILMPRERAEGEKAKYYHPFPLPGFEGALATHSDLYALIAIHNWHRLSQETTRVRAAVREGRLAQHLIDLVEGEMGQRAKRFRDALVWMARAELETGSNRLYKLMAPHLRALVDIATLDQRRADRVRTKPKYTPADYSFDDPRYPWDGPPAGKDVLLIVACSKGKPYSESAHQREVLQELKAAFGEHYEERVHKVTLSGLYGPVPAERETCDPVLNYDFMLRAGDEAQAEIVSERLKKYLSQYKNHYSTVVAFVFFAGYREVVERAFREVGVGKVLPAHPKRGGKPKRYRQELVGHLEGVLPRVTMGQLKLPLDK